MHHFQIVAPGASGCTGQKPSHARARNNDGVYDHEAIVTASDSTTKWDLVDAHTNNRYHAYWTLAQYNASWATTRIVVLHIPPTTS